LSLANLEVRACPGADPPQEARLAAHDAHPPGRSDPGRREFRDGSAVFEAQMLRAGAIALDGTAPAAMVRRTIAIVAEWWSIEVLHGEVSAFRWQEQHDSALIEAALTNGVRDGAWHADRWGVVFEVLFDTEEQWEAFCSLPVVRAAWDAVPDPVNGLLVYRGRGGGAGAREPRRPRPVPSSGAVSLPGPADELYLDLAAVSIPAADARPTTAGALQRSPGTWRPAWPGWC
jgi:hypothetical protein